MSRRDLSRKQISEDTLMGFTLMEIGIIFVLVAQSFGAGYRLLVIGFGALLLLCGIVLFVRYLTKNLE